VCLEGQHNDVVNKVQYKQCVCCVLCLYVVRDEVDTKKKRASDPMCTMNSYVDQSIKVHKLKHGSASEVSTVKVVSILFYLRVNVTLSMDKDLSFETKPKISMLRTAA